MTTSVQTFVFKPTGSDEPVNIRSVDREGAPWFVAVDACRGLAMSLVAGARPWLQGLDPCEKITATRATHPELFSGSKAQAITLISESGLYKLIMRSNKPDAKVFQDWVTREVLPAIRKTGGYLLNEEVRETAHADTREAMPLPMDIAEALAPYFAAQAAQTAELIQLQAEGNILLAKLLGTVGKPAPKPKAERFVSARQAQSMGFGEYMTTSEFGLAMTIHPAAPIC